MEAMLPHLLVNFCFSLVKLLSYKVYDKYNARLMFHLTNHNCMVHIHRGLHKTMHSIFDPSPKKLNSLTTLHAQHKLVAKLLDSYLSGFRGSTFLFHPQINSICPTKSLT